MTKSVVTALLALGVLLLCPASAAPIVGPKAGNETIGTPLQIQGLFPEPQLDCLKLSGPASEDPRWSFETASQAKCHATQGAMQHWTVTIPNDKIFDESDIAVADYKCGSAVFHSLSLFWCGRGHFSCALGDDGVAHLKFTCGIGTHPKHVTAAFRKGTCNAFPEVECWKDP